MMRLKPEFSTAKLFEVWFSEMSHMEAARALGVSRYQFYALGRNHNLGRRTHVQGARARDGHEDEEISPEEFESRKAEVQAKWSDDEREKRRVGPSARPWRLPSYAYDGRVCAFAENTLD
jgi:hypothetical protein